MGERPPFGRTRPRAASLLTDGVVALAGCLAAGAAGCVAPGGDVSLAPLYTRASSAGGGTVRESLFGVHADRRAEPGGPVEAWAVRPLFGWRAEPDGETGPPPAANARWRADYLYPLGRVTSGVRTSSQWLLPLYLWRDRETPGGGRRRNLLALPGIWWAGDTDGGSSLAWFPFWGRVEDFLTYDEIRFALFPLYVSAERSGSHSTHFLFPVLGWTRGGGERSFRLWPLWLHSDVEGLHERTTLLWPFVHWGTSGSYRGDDQTTHRWMIWPFFGRMERNTYSSTTVLWPFFGWATDPRGDFWAVDAPWPLVRIQSGGRNPQAAERFRLWPFYSHFREGALETWSVAWPLVQDRVETYDHARRSSFFALPFWQAWRRRSFETEERTSWWKLWPLAQRRDDGETVRFSTLAPLPFHRDPLLDFFYAWPLELWATETGEQVRRERSWGGLWRRERDATEDRRSLSGLFARRTYREEGRRVHETSLLFGLLRWRTMEDAGTELLAPAFPGPGWPAERGDEPLCGPAEAPPSEPGEP